MLLPNLLKRDFRLVKDFISVEEERQLYKFFMKRFHRFNGNSTSSYETQHFDKVISKYRECTFTLPIEPMNISIATHTASPLEALLNNILIERIIPATKCEDSSDGLSLPQIMPCHVLDLAPGGSIDYHIDNKEVRCL